MDYFDTEQPGISQLTYQLIHNIRSNFQMVINLAIVNFLQCPKSWITPGSTVVWVGDVLFFVIQETFLVSKGLFFARSKYASDAMISLSACSITLSIGCQQWLNFRYNILKYHLNKKVFWVYTFLPLDCWNGTHEWKMTEYLKGHCSISLFFLFPHFKIIADKNIKKLEL